MTQLIRQGWRLCFSSLLIIPECGAVSKAFSRSKKMAPVYFFEGVWLNPSVICWVNLRMWSWQLLLVRTPDCSGGYILFASAHSLIFWLTILSSSLARQTRSEIGLYDENWFGGFPFLWIIIIFAAFHVAGICPRARDDWNNLRINCNTIGGLNWSNLLEIPSFPGADLLLHFWRALVISGSVMVGAGSVLLVK